MNHDERKLEEIMREHFRERKQKNKDPISAYKKKGKKKKEERYYRSRTKRGSQHE